MDSYGIRIKAIREAAGLTQTALGALIGVTGVTIMRYERGQREPKIHQLEKIAQALSISLSFFQCSAPFESLTMLDEYKPVILYALEKRRYIDLRGGSIAEITSFEYWKCISDHISSIVRSSNNTLDIQFFDGNAQGSERVTMVAGKLDFGVLLSALVDSAHITTAYQILRRLPALNQAGCDKLLDRMDELTSMGKYKI